MRSWISGRRLVSGAFCLVCCALLFGHLGEVAVIPRMERVWTIDGVSEIEDSSVGRLQAMDGIRVWAGWTASGVGVYIEVDDPEYAVSPIPTELYLGDSIEFAWDVANDSGFDYDEGDFHFFVTAPDESGSPPVIAMGRHPGSRQQVENYLRAAAKRNASGYAVEVWFCGEALGLLPKGGASSGFELVVRDFDPGKPASSFAWSGMKASLREPIRWGDLRWGNSPDTDLDRNVAFFEAHRKRAQEDFSARYEDPPAEASAGELVELGIVRRRLEKQFLKAIDQSKVEAWLENQQENGSWAELDYGYESGFVMDSANRHLYWLNDLAVAYADEANPLFQNPRLLQALQRGLRYWCERDFRFRNWWNNEIGTPLILGKVALLMGDGLTPALRESSRPILHRAYAQMTGQNLLWINQVILIRGILEENPGLVRRAFEAISEEIAITSGEGIQPDFSFHQHGPLLYNHGYGAGFILDGARILASGAGTEFQLSDEKLNLLIAYVLDGSRWMARGSFADFGAMGRNITRPHQTARYLSESARILLTFRSEREAELQALLASARGATADSLSGHRHFFRSDFSVHRREDFYISYRMYSARTIGTESFNGEGLQSYYLPDGCMLTVRDGGEYAEIQPLWDWRKLPGVTAPQSSAPIPSINYHVAKTTGNTDFVGGVSDGTYGAAAFDYDRDGVSVKKGVFGFDWGVVCLGADLTSTREEPIATTLNQAFWRSDIQWRNLEGEVKVIGPTNEEIISEKDVTWVHHDETLYWLQSQGLVEIEGTTRTGSWRTINLGGPNESVSGKIFTLALDHGIHPHGESFAYAVFPGVGADSILGSPSIPFTILANSATSQAIQDSRTGIIQGIFYASGELMGENGEEIKVNHPCMVLLKPLSDRGGWAVAASNPRHEALELEVEVRLPKIPEPIVLNFALPGEAESTGSTLIQTIRR